jgi:hypothetical protein
VILAVAFVLGILIIYRFGRAPSAISPVLEQRLQSLEVAIGRSDTILRDEFGRGREEVRESSRSLREKVTGLFGNLSDALRASLGEKLDIVSGQITTLTKAMSVAKKFFVRPSKNGLTLFARRTPRSSIRCGRPLMRSCKAPWISGLVLPSRSSPIG